MPPPFLGAPFRAFPSQRSWSPLEATSSPVVVHPRAERTAPSLITTGFPDAHTLRRACLVSPAAMGSLFTSRSPLPGRPGPKTVKSPIPRASPTSKLFSPCESVRVDSSCPDPTADTLLSSCPSRVSRQTSEPPTRPDPRARAHTSPEGSVSRLRGPQPPAPGETSPPPRRRRLDLSAASNPLRGWAAPPLGGVSFPRGLVLAVARAPWPSGLLSA
jgi:hypothetical protein